MQYCHQLQAITEVRTFIFSRIILVVILLKKRKTYLHELKCSEILILLEWLEYMPDLNVIENLWAYFEYIVKDRCTKTSDELWKELRRAWMMISNDRRYLKTLIESMPRRIQAVLDANGGPTKY